MRFFPFILSLLFVVFSCTTTKELNKENDPAVDLGQADREGPTLAEATHKRPTDIKSLVEVMELSDMEIIEFKKIYKNHGSRIMELMASEKDSRTKFIEKKSILESRDLMVLKMLDGKQRKIYLDYLHDLEKRKKENSKDGQNDKM